MNECGLVGALQDDSSEGDLVITRELVERVAHERGLKRMCMEVQHVLLP